MAANPVSFEQHGASWRFFIEPDAVHGVWFHVTAGPGSISSFITPEQARALGELLIEASAEPAPIPVGEATEVEA